MSASNHSWVCFDCRLAVRQPKTARRIPRCAACGARLFCVGDKVGIPKKENGRAWQRFHWDCLGRAEGAANAGKVAAVRAQHQAERRIAELAALPANKDRSKLIAELRKQILLPPSL